MGVPIDLSVLYTRKPEILKRAFSLVPEYLRTAEDARVVNLMDYGVPLGRRFRAPQALVRDALLRPRGLGRAHSRPRRLGAGTRRDDCGRTNRFELCAPVPLSLVCFRRKGSDETNRELLERVNASGEVFFSHTVLDGRFVLRLAIGNHGTTRRHVLRAWESSVADLAQDYRRFAPVADGRFEGLRRHVWLARIANATASFASTSMP